MPTFFTRLILLVWCSLQIFSKGCFIDFLKILEYARFLSFGGAVPYRPVEDIAFAVARFFQLGGTFQNYYMVLNFFLLGIFVGEVL